MDLAKVRIHRQTPTEKNPYVVIAAMWCSSGGWHRTLKHKRIDTGWLLERDMDEQERREERTYSRLHWYRYKTWEALILDEWKITGNLTWCSSILAESGLKYAISDILPLPAPGIQDPQQLTLF